jgi:hypothetical protein
MDGKGNEFSQSGLKTALIALVALAAIAGSAFYLFHKPSEKGEKLATDASEALGLRAGEEVARLLGNKGRVAMLERQFKPGEAPTALVTVQNFSAALNKHGITVARTKSFPGGLSAMVMGSGIPANEFTGAVDGPPSVDAVITFAGLPNMPAEELGKFQANHPPLVVVDIFGVLKGDTLPSLVARKTVALAFSPRSALEVQELGNESRLFERYYKILRAERK